MRNLTAAALVLAIGVAVLGAPAPEKSYSSGPLGPGIGSKEAETYAELMKAAIQKISSEYIREVSEEKLAAAAIQSLFETAATPTPDRWRGNPAEILQGKVLGDELRQARLAAGNPPALRGDNAIRISLQAMVKQLDPYCAYVTSEDLSRNPTDDRKIGTGIQIEERNEPGLLYVRTVTIGSLAQKMGVLPGDALLAIDGETTVGLTARQADKRLNQGALESHVDVIVRSQGQQEARPLPLSRALLPEEPFTGVRRADRDSWDYILDSAQRIAYVRVGAIPRGVSMDREDVGGPAGDLREALLATKRSGLSGLVLDLRDCPVGYIDPATEIAGLFLTHGTLIATVHYKDPRENDRVYRSMGGKFVQLPMVVLIGPDTSGAGELIAGALQDSHRAPVIGQRTRGKDTLQLADDSNRLSINNTHHGLRLSIGQFLRPSGKNLGRLNDSKPWDEWGIQPDEGLEVRLTADVRRQIRQWRLRHDLRSPDSREVLPLDDVTNDPVLNAGLQELRRLMHAKSTEENKPKEKEAVQVERGE